MGTNQTLPHLDKMVEELLKDIKKIESEGKAQISDKIMERLRGETIFLRKSYVNAKKDADHCTIDPNKCIDLELSELEDGIGEDKINLIKNGIIAIKGNSFGPYYPNEYFKETTFKVLWLLKESYIELPSFDAGDRGGHNQAAEYAAYGVKGNETHENLVAYTRKLLSTIEKIDESASDHEVMKHICIIEANHFPGLAFKSKNSDNNSNDKQNLINQWIRINIKSINELIHLYCPDIVVGGGILKYLHQCKSYDKVLQKTIKQIPQNVLMGLDYEPNEEYANDIYITQTANYIIPTINRGPIFIQAHHPTAKEFNSDQGTEDGRKIKTYLNS